MHLLSATSLAPTLFHLFYLTPGSNPNPTTRKYGNGFAKTYKVHIFDFSVGGVTAWQRKVGTVSHPPFAKFCVIRIAACACRHRHGKACRASSYIMA